MADPALDAVCPVMLPNTSQVKIRHNGMVCNKAVYRALTLSREKEVLGLWVEQTEGVRFDNAKPVSLLSLLAIRPVPTRTPVQISGLRRTGSLIGSCRQTLAV